MLGKDDYFEGQHGRDCVIHSLNNAFGRRVVTKQEVLDFIEKRIAQEMKAYETMDPRDIKKKEAAIRSRYSSGTTFFAADVVWDCAKEKGEFSLYVPIPGFTTPFLRMEVMTPDVVVHPIVLLGGDKGKGTHAVGVRNGVIYDSERVKEGPRPLLKEEVTKSLPRVFGAYAFLKNPQDIVAIRRVNTFLKYHES